jgi:hypothetical protein
MCDISLGRLEPCDEQNGGIKSVYFANYTAGLETTATFDANDQITAFASLLTLYKYDVRLGTNSYDETNEKSRENGTSFWNQSGSLQLKKQDVGSHKELRIATHGTPLVFIEDYNGNILLSGLENGVSISVNTTVGTAMGDFNGYTLTWTGMEGSMASFVDPTIIDDAVNTTVVEGV